jgi:hypothetical protein
VTYFDEAARDLLTHMAAMGGWLTAGYINDDNRPVFDRLRDEGLIEPATKDGRPHWQLTPAGHAAAAQIAQEG